MQTEISTMPADELADVLDMMIWDMSGVTHSFVEDSLLELLARPDANTKAVREAFACIDYLTPDAPLPTDIKLSNIRLLAVTPSFRNC